MTIADNLQTLIDCKADMKAAIEEKGVTVSGGLSTYADAIRDITKYVDAGGLDFSALGYNESNIVDIISNLQECIDYGASLKNNCIRETPIEYYTANIYGHEGGAVVCYTWFQGNLELVIAPSVKTSECECKYHYPPADMFNCSQNLRAVGKIIIDGEYTNCADMFHGCTNLTYIEPFDTSMVTGASDMFYHCWSLKHIPLMDFSNVRSISGICAFCKSLEDIDGFVNLGKIEDFNTYNNGAFLDAPNISRQSCINIFSNLFDRATAGYSVVQLTFEPEVIARLTNEDIAIATSKGWTITT